MPFLLLLILTVVCLQSPWPAALGQIVGPVGSILLTTAGIAGLAGWAGALTQRYRGCLLRETSNRYDLARRFSAWRRYHLYAQLVFFLTALYGFGWGWTIKRADAPALPGLELLLLAPLVASLTLSWAFFYGFERAAHDLVSSEDSPFPSRWAYVGLQARANFLLTLPPLVLILVEKAFLYWFHQLGYKPSEAIQLLFAALLLAGTFVGLPLVLRLLLRLKPLPEGPLRTRLLTTARRLGFRCNNLLLWNTHNTLANAMVTGPLPFLRYVVFTDKLLNDMTADEIEAVFGHEIGHVKHQHMLFYLVFLLGSLLTLAGVCQLAVEGLDQLGFSSFLEEFLGNRADPGGVWETLATLPLLLIVGVYIFVVFGFLSRRCERQADIFGCRTVSCEVFIGALEKVALLNGLHREKPGWLSSWQHSTIARRVEFLQHMSVDPAVEPHFQWRVGLMKMGVMLGLGACLTALMLILGPARVWAELTGTEDAAASQGAVVSSRNPT